MYTKKITALETIAQLTRNTNLAPDESAADRYINLMDRRRELLEQVMELDTKIKLAEDEYGNSPAYAAEKSAYESEILDKKRSVRQLSQDILALDQRMSAIVPLIMADVKRHMVNLSAGKAVSQRYTPSAEMAGSTFDRQQ